MIDTLAIYGKLKDKMDPTLKQDKKGRCGSASPPLCLNLEHIGSEGNLCALLDRLVRG